MPIDIHDLLRILHQRKGSDLHLTSGERPFMRVHGNLEPCGNEPLALEDMLTVLKSCVTEEEAGKFMKTGDLDLAWEIPEISRYRINFYKTMDGIAASFRAIPTEILPLEELSLPAHLRELALLPKGLVLVTGPTGSGKSTTIASIVDYANRMRRDHIITIEDPIEFVHSSGSCLVNQREVGTHTKSFASALRSALREDPDIIVVGEMRDLETIALALEAAETGHLVFSTLHTISASKTLDRIIQSFPVSAQEQIRSSLAESIQAIISQVLLRNAQGNGRVPALEILFATGAVRNLIREGKTYQIPNVLQTSRELGMCGLDDSLEKLLAEGAVEPRAALAHAVNKQRMRDRIRETEAAS